MALRHVPRVHRVNLDWLIDRIRTDPGIDIKFLSTKLQIANIPTKAIFNNDQWNYLCRLAQVGPAYKPKSALPISASNRPLCSHTEAGTPQLQLACRAIAAASITPSVGKPLSLRSPGVKHGAANTANCPTNVLGMHGPANQPQPPAPPPPPWPPYAPPQDFHSHKGKFTSKATPNLHAQATPLPFPNLAQDQAKAWMNSETRFVRSAIELFIDDPQLQQHFMLSQCNRNFGIDPTAWAGADLRSGDERTPPRSHTPPPPPRVRTPPPPPPKVPPLPHGQQPIERPPAPPIPHEHQPLYIPPPPPLPHEQQPENIPPPPPPPPLPVIQPEAQPVVSPTSLASEPQ